MGFGRTDSLGFKRTNKSAYGCVGSVTEAAGEEFGMFDGVRGQMNLQAGGVCVTTIAVVAFVRFVFVVLPAVRLRGETTQISLWLKGS